MSTCSFSKDLNDLEVGFDNIDNVLDEKGFLLAFIKYKALPFEELLSSKKIDYRKRCNDFVRKALESGYTLIDIKYDSFHTMSVLLRKPSSKPKPNIHIIHVKTNNFDWVEDYKSAQMNLKDNEQIWLLANDKHSGIIGAFNCLKKEPFGDHIRFVMSENLSGNTIPKEVLELDLQHNVFSDGVWGQMRHLLLDKQSLKLKETKHAYINVQNKGN